MFKKTGVIILTLVMSLSIFFTGMPKKANASTLNNQPGQGVIVPYSNEAGSGVGGGYGEGFTYFSGGVVLYNHPYLCSGKTGTHSTVYIPHSFIDSLNKTVGNWTTPLVIAGAAKLLKVSITNPIAIAVGTVLALQWGLITAYDSAGNGVTLVFGASLVSPDKIISGCNYYAH